MWVLRPLLTHVAHPQRRGVRGVALRPDARESPTAHLIHVLSHHEFVHRGRHARRAARLLGAVRRTLGVDAPPPRRDRCDLRRLLSHRHILRCGDRRRERVLLSRPHRRKRGLAWRVAGLLPPPGGLMRLTLALRSHQRTGHVHRDGPGGPGQRLDRANRDNGACAARSGLLPGKHPVRGCGHHGRCAHVERPRGPAAVVDHHSADARSVLRHVSDDEFVPRHPRSRDRAPRSSPPRARGAAPVPGPRIPSAMSPRR